MQQVQADQLIAQQACALLDLGQCKEAIELSQQIAEPLLRAAILIDGGAYLGKRTVIEEGIQLLEAGIDRDNAPFARSSLLYNTANGYSALYDLRRRKGTKLTPPNEDDLRLAKSFYRAAIAASGDKRSRPFASQLWTNYANSLSALGRTVDAIAANHEAAQLEPHHAMALGNLAVELEYFSRIVGRHRHDYILYCHDLLKQVLTGQAHLRYGDPRSMDRFQETFDDLEHVIQAHSKGIAPTKPFRQTKGRFGDYVRFCHENRLFLNAWVGDIRFAPASSDDIHYGPIIVRLEDDQLVPALLRILNEIRESFATARYLFYLSQQSDPLADRCSKLTLYDDYFGRDLHGLPLGFLKASYARAFEVLDKVARIVNIYFGYGNERFSFWDTLATKESRGQAQEIRFVLRPELAKHGNVGLFALGDMCIDYHANQIASLRQFDKRRNLIAHHFLAVTYDEFVGEDDERQVGLADLRAQTLEILKLAKHAIIYAVIAVNHSELMKRAERNHELIPDMFYEQVTGLPSGVL